MEDFLKDLGEYRRLGVKLRAWRKTQKMSSKNLAREVSASNTYILQVEKGLRHPPDPDSAIGNRLYPLVKMLPTAHERFLWSQLSLYPRAMRNLATALFYYYLSHGVHGDAAHEVIATFPRSLQSVDSVFAVRFLDSEHRIVEIDDPSEIQNHLRDVPDGAIVDWIYEMTFALRYAFPLFKPEFSDGNETNEIPESNLNPAAMTLQASLRYSLSREGDTVMVPIISL